MQTGITFGMYKQHMSECICIIYLKKYQRPIDAIVSIATSDNI